MKRAALIGIISLAGLLSLWLLQRVAGQDREQLPATRPGMRFENKGDKASAPETIVVYQPRHFADGEVGHYQVRMEKGFLKMPAGKVTFAAQQIDHNGTKLAVHSQWRCARRAGAVRCPLDCERAVHPLARISHRAKGFGLAQCGAAV